MAFNCRSKRPLRMAGDCLEEMRADGCQNEVRGAGDSNGFPSAPGELCRHAPMPRRESPYGNAYSRLVFTRAIVLEELCGLLEDSAELLELIGSGDGTLLASLSGSSLARHCLEEADRLRDSLEQIEAIALGGVATWAPAEEA
jgi:hypothetical protein